MQLTARIAAILIMASSAAWGQNTFPSSGNVGIGTTSPINYSGYTTLTINGTTSGVLAVQAAGSMQVLQLYGDTTNGGAIDTSGNGLPMRFLANGERMRITATGTVGIGTTTPNSSYKLDVAGPIAATDIYVTNNALPDYVFDAGYKNAPLSEVAAYIEQNHHLPGMPSAAEVERNRLSVADMQNKLLQKVEELTLHMIAADERNNKLEQENRQLQDRLVRLESAARTGKKE